MNPGELRHEITVQSLSSARDEYGAITETYSTFAVLRAGVKFISGTKGLDNKETFSSQVVKFTTYYREVKETMRILHHTKLYRILSIEEVGFKEGLIINAELINE